MSWIDGLIFGFKNFLVAGVKVPLPNTAPQPTAINAVSGATAVYNAATNSIDVTFTGSGGGIGAFGDQSDGTATCDGTTAVPGMTLAGGNYTMTRAVYFASLTVHVGAAVNTAGFPYFSLNTVNNGHIHADGAPGGVTGGAASGSGGGSGSPGGTGGAPQGTAMLGGGGCGGHGFGAVATVLNALGGAGGGSNLVAPGAVSPPPAWVSPARDLLTAIAGYAVGINGGNVGTVMFNGGAGGSGGGSSGGWTGGGGGGYLVACTLALSGSGRFSADGGAGVPDATDGSGGGGGGRVVLVTRDTTAWTGTVTANGGAAAAVGGLAGANGTVVQLTA